MHYEALILKLYCLLSNGENVYLSFLLCCYSETEEVTLHILGVSVEDSGVYTCVATNVAGSVTSSASLKVSGESPVMV